jgi:hypothetical protein
LGPNGSLTGISYNLELSGLTKIHMGERVSRRESSFDAGQSGIVL